MSHQMPVKCPSNRPSIEELREALDRTLFRKEPERSDAYRSLSAAIDDLERLREAEVRFAENHHKVVGEFQQLRAENERLRAALEKYEHCYHGVPDCNCTATAREALGRRPNV